jgi:hypothetical protein
MPSGRESDLRERYLYRDMVLAIFTNKLALTCAGRDINTNFFFILVLSDAEKRLCRCNADAI